MRFLTKMFLLPLIAFWSTAALASSQWRAEIPFVFDARGQLFPAGNYDIAFDPAFRRITMSSHFLPMRRITWIAVTGEHINVPAVIRFDRLGPQYVLKNIQVDEMVTPNFNTRFRSSLNASKPIVNVKAASEIAELKVY